MNHYRELDGIPPLPVSLFTVVSGGVTAKACVPIPYCGPRACFCSILFINSDTGNAVKRGSCVSFLAEKERKLTTLSICAFDLIVVQGPDISETGASGGSMHIVYKLGIECTSQESQLKPKYKWI